MATLTISDEVAALAKTRAAENGYANVEALVEALVRGKGEDTVPGPEHLTIRSHEHLVTLVREGLTSPAREMTPAECAHIRSELAGRHGMPKES